MAYESLNLPDNAIPEGADISHIEEGLDELSTSLAEIEGMNIIPFYTGTTSTSPDDLNGIDNNGIYYYSGYNVTDSSSQYGFLFNIHRSSTTGMQLFFQINANSQNFYMRVYSSGWGSWVQFAKA